ncbi:MAG TPA: DUF4337 domain-containing protein [Gemmataceae bacterium]|nr:DUF4337 domain-containing protein [Gemmataceae bacterium]
MAEVEVPDPEEVKEKAGDPFTRQVALFVAVYAVALAVTSLGGSNATKDMMMAQQKATNLWAYYQAKVVRENLYLLEAEKLDLELEVRGVALGSDERKRLEQVRERYRAKAAEYTKEKQEIKAQAEEMEKERDTAARKDPYFDYAEVLLQIAIVLASVAMLSGKRWAFWASLAFAGIGLLLCVNGYTLLAAVPGLG